MLVDLALQHALVAGFEVVLSETLLVHHAARFDQAQLVLLNFLSLELVPSLLFRDEVVLEVLVVDEVLAVEGLPLRLQIPLVIPVEGVVKQLV